MVLPAPIVQLYTLRQRPIAQRQPAGRNHQAQFEARFQVGLVKQRERRAGTIGYEQRIEKIRVAVERAVARDQVDRHLVVPRVQGSHRQQDVLLRQFDLRGGTVDTQGADSGLALAKVQLQRYGIGRKFETDDRLRRYRSSFIGRDLEPQPVVKPGDERGPGPGKFL